MKKVIIHYEGDLQSALSKVSRVVEMGRISEAGKFKQFCFITQFDPLDVAKPMSFVYAMRKRREDCDTFKVVDIESVEVQHAEV